MVESEADEKALEEKPFVRLCDMCHREPCKYRCPRCAYRTCSLACSKDHKVRVQCIGERSADDSFPILRRFADFTSATAVMDKKFLDVVRESITASVSNGTAVMPKATVEPQGDPSSNEDLGFRKVVEEANKGDSDLQVKVVAENSEIHVEAEKHAVEVANDTGGASTLCESSAVEQPFSSGSALATMRSGNEVTEDEEAEGAAGNGFVDKTKYYLVRNAFWRRIWLTVDPAKEDGSRHEHHSDVIFWTIDLIFRREIGSEEDGVKGVDDYTYTTNNIPESILLGTLIRQFIKPKKVGPVVSRGDLDEEKMLPFQNAGMDGLMLYMQVPSALLGGKQRFYVMNASKTILENLRNRFVFGHPVVFVTLGNQCNDFVLLSEQEAQDMKSASSSNPFGESRRRGGFRGRGNSFDHGRRDFGSRGRGHFVPRGAHSREFGRPPTRGFKRAYDDDSSYRGHREYGRERSFGDGERKGHGRSPWKRERGGWMGVRDSFHRRDDHCKASAGSVAVLAAEDARRSLRDK